MIKKIIFTIILISLLLYIFYKIKLYKLPFLNKIFSKIHNIILNIKIIVKDLSFKKLIAVIRLSVPYTGMILSTRERAELRRDLFEVGISQISAGSRTAPP